MHNDAGCAVSGLLLALLLPFYPVTLFTVYILFDSIMFLLTVLLFMSYMKIWYGIIKIHKQGKSLAIMGHGIGNAVFKGY